MEFIFLGGSHGLVVMGGDSCSRGCKFNPHLVIFHINFLLNLLTFEKAKKEMKMGLGMAHLMKSVFTKGGDSCSRGCEFKSQLVIFHIHFLNNLVTFEKLQNKVKRGWEWPI